MNKSDSIDETKLRETINGFMESRALLSAIELDIFTAAGLNPLSSDEIARKLNTDPRATNRLLNVLVAMGYMDKNKNKYRNKTDVDRLLNRASKDFIFGLGHSINKWESWTTLTAAVRKGTSVLNLDRKVKKESRSRSFIEAMHYRASRNAGQILSALDTRGIRRILDVGGGSGGYSMAFCRQAGDITATVMDLPEIIPITRQYIRDEGLENRMDTLAGDYLKADFPPGYDLVIMSAIIHINNPAENQKLIVKGANALLPGGRLLVQDFLVDEDRTGPLQAVLFALNMLVATRGGDTYTESEIRAWMAKAGLSNLARIDYGKNSNLLVGTKVKS